jgi:son of sevenless
LRRLDPTDVAEQLSLIEWNLYSKITPQECLSYAKTQKGKAVANLNAFCGTHDKLAAWVQSSILYTGALGKRAEMVDFWIKIAEVCCSCVPCPFNYSCIPYHDQSSIQFR